MGHQGGGEKFAESGTNFSRRGQHFLGGDSPPLVTGLDKCLKENEHVLLTLLRSESPSSKCAKLHTVAASNSRDHDHSIIACSRHIYMGVVLRAHPVRGESHIQRNANREVATTLSFKLTAIIIFIFTIIGFAKGGENTEKTQ